MSQLNWIYLDDFGRKYRVGLYHGEQSGHLMVYCNARVLLIDFNVLSPKKYSFYLGDELCDLILEQDNGRFSYGLVPNQHVDTPLNRLRRSQRRKNYLQSAAIGLVLVGLVIFLSRLLMTIY